MTLTRSRTIQYIGILLALGLMAVGYWYFAVRAGVKSNTANSQPQGYDGLDSSLSAYWRLDENTGTSTTDASTNGATGTLTNSPTWTTGQIGSAVDFDGTDDYITTPDADPLELTDRSRFTIAGWFNRDTFTTDDTILAKRNGIAAGDSGYIVYIDDATDQLIFEFSDAVDEVSAASTTTFTATGWHHFVVTQVPGSGNPTIYIDGLLDAPTITGNINDMEPAGNAVAFRLGAESDAGNPFDGKLDEIRYYHGKSLSSDQVTELYRLTTPTGVDTSLKGYWAFDGQDTLSYAVYDWSGAGNPGTINGTGTAPAPTPTAGRIGQALTFDGVDDYITMGSPANLDDISDLTVCVWAKRGFNAGGVLISKDGSATGWNFVMNGLSDMLRVYSGWSGGIGYARWDTASGVVPVNEWTHLCFVYNRTSTTNDPVVYINAVSVPVTEAQTPSGTMTSDASMFLNIGTYDNGASDFFDGEIDEARIYNRLFTAAEIKSLYDRGTPNKTNTNAAQAQGGSDLAAGLALYWPLDEGTGTNADDKGVGQNDGTLTGGPTWTTGQIGSAVDFDGTDDYVAVADPASGILDFAPPSAGGPTAGDVWSISLWFNRDTATTDDTLIAKKNSQTTDTDDGYIVWIDDATDEINVRLDTNTDADETSVSSTTTYTSAGWHHLVVVLDGDHFEGLLGMNNCPFIFVDGLHVTDASTCANYLHYVEDTSNALAFTVGAESDGGNPFDGKMDDVRVYNRVFTPDDILALYRNAVTTSGIDTGLRGYWSFEASDKGYTNGGVVYDRSGAGNWGELMNGPPIVRGRVGQALYFDGVNEYVDVAAATLINNQHTFTYAAWIYPTGATCGNGYGPIIEKGTGSGLKKSLLIDCSGASGDRTLYGTVDTATTDAMSYTAAGVIAYNEWQHVAMTYDDAGDRLVRLYINGREQPYDVQTAGTGAVATDTTDDIAIGATPSTQFYAFVGMIDEPRVYGRVLSSSELASLAALGTPDKVNTSVSTPQGTGRLDSGLVGYWALDENTGTSAGDTSTGGNAGTLTNGPTWTTGRIGSALSFDGTNDYVTMGDIAAAEGGNQVTAAAWIKQNGATNERHVLDKGDCVGGGSWELLVINGEADFYMPGLSHAVASGTNVSDNQWHHIAATYDGAAQRIYVDGSLAGTYTGAASVATNAYAVEIGGNCQGGGSCGGSCYWNGQIDEARVYDRALSADELRQLYDLGAPTGTDTSLKGYWSFNGPDMNGTTANDRSGAGNDGTLTNGPTRARGKLGQALNFDGTDDYVAAAAQVAITGSKSVSFWMKPDQLDSDRFVFYSSDGTNNDFLAVALFGSRVYTAVDNVYSAINKRSNADLTAGDWYHVVVTKTTNNVENIYINSVNATETGNDFYSGATSGTFLGGSSAESDFDGTLDEVRIYNRILTAAEIKALYSSGK